MTLPLNYSSQHLSPLFATRYTEGYRVNVKDTRMYAHYLPRHIHPLSFPFPSSCKCIDQGRALQRGQSLTDHFHLVLNTNKIFKFCYLHFASIHDNAAENEGHLLLATELGCTVEN